MSRRASPRRAVLIVAGALIAMLLSAEGAQAQDTSIVSRTGNIGVGADGLVSGVAVSGDGRYVAFISTATNLGGPTDGTAAVYLKDTQSGTLGLVSRATGASGVVANAGSSSVSMSADGRYVAFVSTATNLGAGSAGSHVYVRDTQGLTTTAVDRATGTGAALGGSGAVISADGGYVAFEGSQDAYSGGSTGNFQVYLRDLSSNTTELVSRATGAGAVANDNSGTDGSGGRAIGISSSGRFVAFVSAASNLTADANPGVPQIFLRDRNLSGTTTLVSRAGTSGAAGDDASDTPTVSTSGTVAFASQALNLGSNVAGAFVRPLGGPTVVASRAPGLAGAVHALGSTDAVAISGDGTTVAWLSGDPLAGNGPPGVSTSAVIQRRRIADGAQDVVNVNALGAPLGSASGPLAISDDGVRVAFSADPSLVDSGAGTTKQVLLRDSAFAAPQATTAPSIAGTASSGRPLTCETGEWSSFPTQFSWQWLRDGTPVATTARYVVTDADVGHTLTCEVTATNGQATVATSAGVVPSGAAAPPSGAFVFLGTFGAPGTGGPGQFTSGLGGIAVAPDGNIVVADRGVGGTPSLELYTPSGAFVRALAPAGAGDGSIGALDGVAVAGTGEIVAYGAGRAQRFTQDAYLLGAEDCGKVALNPRTSIAADSNGLVYAGGRLSSGPGVVICDAAGSELSVPLSSPASQVSAIAIGPDGDLYALAGTTVVVMDSGGAVLRSFPVADQLALAVGPDGHVWVGGQHVTEYSASGVTLGSFGTNGTSPGQFVVATALAITSDGDILVADGDNERIERFREVQATSGGGGADGGGGAPPAPVPTGRRAAALKKCKKQHGRARQACVKKAKRLPI